MNHPITPPPELFGQWLEEFFGPETMPGWHQERFCYTSPPKPPAGGADAELEACCEYLRDNTSSEVHCVIDAIRAARRPKPPSLAEDALKALQDQIDTSFKISSEAQERANTIRTALERLQELEQLSDDRLSR